MNHPSGSTRWPTVTSFTFTIVDDMEMLQVALRPRSSYQLFQSPYSPRVRKKRGPNSAVRSMSPAGGDDMRGTGALLRCDPGSALIAIGRALSVNRTTCTGPRGPSSIHPLHPGRRRTSRPN